MARLLRQRALVRSCPAAQRASTGSRARCDKSRVGERNACPLWDGCGQQLCVCAPSQRNTRAAASTRPVRTAHEAALNDRRRRVSLSSQRRISQRGRCNCRTDHGKMSDQKGANCRSAAQHPSNQTIHTAVLPATGDMARGYGPRTSYATLHGHRDSVCNLHTRAKPGRPHQYRCLPYPTCPAPVAALGPLQHTTESTSWHTSEVEPPTNVRLGTAQASTQVHSPVAGATAWSLVPVVVQAPCACGCKRAAPA